jgi:hypothetical protein
MPLSMLPTKTMNVNREFSTTKNDQNHIKFFNLFDKYYNIAIGLY